MKGFILWNYTRLPDILFIIILLCIFALSVFLIRKIHKKKIYVITILIFVFTVVFWGYFHRNYGIKEISYPLIQGDNTITDSEKISNVIDALHLNKMDEIPYEKSSDPGQKNGKTTVLEITYNNDQKIMIISDDDYAVIRKEGKSYLYRK